MKLILIICALIAIIYGDREAFEKFKKKYDKKYLNIVEEEKHFANFQYRDDKINMHNNQPKTFTMAHNEFSDLSEEEFSKLYLHEINITPNATLLKLQGNTPDSFPKGPPSISYKNITLPIVNQGTCGACWAFATSAQVETTLKKRNSTYNTPLSNQYLLDCAENAGCTGGGIPSIAFEYLRTNGLVAESTSPYIAIKQACKPTTPKITEKINNITHFDLNGNEQQLANIVASVGPVVVSIFAPSSFQLYRGGIFYELFCPAFCTLANHAVLVVGYGTDTISNPAFPIDYWIIKNSWGPTWGENGYGRMIKGFFLLNNNCNVACRIDYSS